MFTGWWRQPQRPVIPSPAWPEMVIALSIHAFNEGVSTSWYIDSADSFDNTITPSITLNAPLCPALAHFIIHYAPRDCTHTLLIKEGMLIGVEPSCEWLPGKPQGIMAQSEALCTKYQCTIIDADPTTRNFTCITAERRWSELSSHHALAILKQLVRA